MSALTPKERRVMELLAAGQRSRPIAKELGITLSTFYSYCDRARIKLNAPTTGAAIRRFMELAGAGADERREAQSEGAWNP